MDVLWGDRAHELSQLWAAYIHSHEQHVPCVTLPCILQREGGTRVRMSADDIRAGFAGADDYAKQDTFKLPEYVVPHDWNVAEIAWELYG